MESPLAVFGGIVQAVELPDRVLVPGATCWGAATLFSPGPRHFTGPPATAEGSDLSAIRFSATLAAVCVLGTASLVGMEGGLFGDVQIVRCRVCVLPSEPRTARAGPVLTSYVAEWVSLLE